MLGGCTATSSGCTATGSSASTTHLIARLRAHRVSVRDGSDATSLPQRRLLQRRQRSVVLILVELDVASALDAQTDIVVAAGRLHEIEHGAVMDRGLLHVELHVDTP